MIKATTTDTKLGIILTNTNKALAEAIKHASAEQLSQIQENKDVRSFLNSVLNDTLISSRSDKTLLDILKNAPAFKNMGNFPDELNTLLSKIKDLPALSSKAPALETFIQNSSKTNGDTLKTQIANSGVFMESKIASAVGTSRMLIQTLESLKTLLSQSSLADAKPIRHTVASLLDGADIQNARHDPKSAQNLTNTLRSIVDSYQQVLSKIDVLYSEPTRNAMMRLNRFASIEPLPSSPLLPDTAHEIRSVLSQLYGSLLKSTATETNSLLDSIETLLKHLDDTAKPAEKIAIELHKFTDNLQNARENPDTALRPETSALIAKIAQVSGPEDIMLDALLQDSLSNDLKSQLMKLAEEISSTSDLSGTELLDPINKLLLQIDYHQLLSHLSASSSIYFPFAWEQLEEGSVAFKKSNDQKFYCEINLKLKEYGKLDLMMALYGQTRLEIQAHTEKNELKELIHDNLPALRTILIDSGLSPQRIRVLGPDESAAEIAVAYENKTIDPGFGFEAKA